MPKGLLGTYAHAMDPEGKAGMKTEAEARKFIEAEMRERGDKSGDFEWGVVDQTVPWHALKKVLRATRKVLLK